MVVLCLISSDFATCSVALHKNVVSVVIKRLSTFTSLALSTLVPMFFFWNHILCVTCLNNDFHCFQKCQCYFFAFFDVRNLRKQLLFFSMKCVKVFRALQFLWSSKKVKFSRACWVASAWKRKLFEWNISVLLVQHLHVPVSNIYFNYQLQLASKFKHFSYMPILQPFVETVDAKLLPHFRLSTFSTPLYMFQQKRFRLKKFLVKVWVNANSSTVENLELFSA